ncbi:MAG TPA: hypothetical protein VN241_11075 [Microbacterium sp.]|nr:hypothetical protein [Microbacterium sp.]
METRAGTGGDEYFVTCAYDLTTLEHPDLGPYGDAASAQRASEEIAVALSGVSD